MHYKYQPTAHPTSCIKTEDSMAIPSLLSLLLIPILFALLVPLAVADYVLYTGEVLVAGQNLTNGPYQLSMHSNCDLVLYHNSKPTWKANITATFAGGANCYLGLKQTGELVVRRDVHYTLWSSSTKSKKGKYALVLDNTGKLSVYGNRKWASNNQKEPAHEPGKSVVSTDYVLYSGHRLTMGRKLEYKEFVMELSKCNLVIRNTKSERILWQTSTKSNGCYLQLEHNGELVLKHVNNRLWSSNKRGDSGVYVAVLRFDGRLAVYGSVVWSNTKNDSERIQVV